MSAEFSEFDTDDFSEFDEAPDPYGLGWQKVGAPDEAPLEPTTEERAQYLRLRQDSTKGREAADMERKYPQLPQHFDAANQDLRDMVDAAPYAIAQGATLGNAKRIGKAFSPAGTPVDSDYAEAERKAPGTTAVVEGLASTPAMMAINPLGRIAGMVSKALNGAPPTLAFLSKVGITGPGAAKIMQMLGAAGDAAITTGVQGFSKSDAPSFEGKAYDGLAGASLAAPLGAGAIAGPEAVMSAGRLAKRGLGKALQQPKAAADAVAEFLGRTKAPPAAEAAPDWLMGNATPEAAVASAAPDNVVPILKDDVATKVTPVRNFLKDEVGAVTYDKRDPAWLKKSGELAEMLGQSPAAPVTPTKPPRGGSPKDPRSPFFSYGEDQGKTVIDRAEQAADWDMGMLDGDGKPWFSKATPEQMTADFERAKAAEARRAAESFPEPLPAEDLAPFPDPITMAPSREGATKVSGPKRRNEAQPPQAPPSMDEILKKIEGLAWAEFKPELLSKAVGTPSPAGIAKDMRGLQRGFPDAPGQSPSFDEMFNGTAKLEPRGGDTFAPRATPVDPNLTRVGGPALRTAKPRGADAVAVADARLKNWDELDAARDRGWKKAEKIGGVAGGVAGVYSGGVLGAYPGYKAGQLGVKGARKAFDKMAEVGGKLAPEHIAQQLASNPAMLQRLAAGAGPIAGAAKFILQGQQEGGENGLKARAFVAASMPQFRELFSQAAPSQAYSGNP